LAFVGVAHHEAVALLMRRFLHALNDARKERIRDIRGDEPTRVAFLEPQPPCQMVGAVPQLLGCPLDQRLRLRTDAVLAGFFVQTPRDRGDRNARFVSNVVQGYSHSLRTLLDELEE